MEQKPAGENPGDAQQQPEIILSSMAAGGTEPASNRVCPSCGTVNHPAAVYCAKCGLKLPDAALQNKKICPGCGTANSVDSQYCYKCGLKLPDKAGSGYENTIRYAGFGMRLLAFLINGILLYILVSIISAVIFMSKYGQSAYSSLLSSLGSSDEINNPFLGSFLGIAVVTALITAVVYSTVSVGVWGRTIGKAALKLRVVKPDGSRVSIERAFGRSLAYILNYFTFGLSFLIIAFTHKKRGLHDYVADTVVIKTD
jgi:uncharacterized RDD family membrane protein YckC/ribosomal protein L40E